MTGPADPQLSESNSSGVSFKFNVKPNSKLRRAMKVYDAKERFSIYFPLVVSIMKNKHAYLP